MVPRLFEIRGGSVRTAARRKVSRLRLWITSSTYAQFAITELSAARNCARRLHILRNARRSEKENAGTAKKKEPPGGDPAAPSASAIVSGGWECDRRR